MNRQQEFDVKSFAKAEAADYADRIGKSPRVAEQKMKGMLNAMLENVPIGGEVTAFTSLESNGMPCQVIVTKASKSSFTIEKAPIRPMKAR